MIVVDATPLQTQHRFRGIGTYTAGLLDAMTYLPHEHALALLQLTPRPGDALLAADLRHRDDVTTLPVHRPRWPRYRFQWLLGSLAVRPVLSAARPRLYHATDPDGLVRVPGVPTVATLYDLIPLHQPAAHFPPRRGDARLGYARYLRRLQRADRLIAISEATKRDAVARLGIAPERIAVTHLAVDARHFYPRTRAETSLAANRYRLRRPYFLHVGAAARHKNTAGLLRAFSAYRREGGDHPLYIAGPWTQRALDDLAREHAALVSAGSLRVLGFVPEGDLPALYSGADALLYPSLMEGFGLPVLEAMRCDCPVLTSATSSLPEAGGNAALYVDPLDDTAMTAALHRLASQPALRADLAARGRRQAGLFSWERTAAQTLRVYAELLA